MAWEQDILIDPDRLDAEWLRQPKLFSHYGQLHAKAKAAADRAKESLDLARAEVDAMIRKAPEKFGLGEKLTEAACSATILRHPTYRAALDLFHSTREAEGIAFAAIRALDHKKDALENLVRLHASEYFAGPSVPHNLREEAARLEQAGRSMVTGAIREGLNRKPPAPAPSLPIPRAASPIRRVLSGRRE
jgi:hypothetical protein